MALQGTEPGADATLNNVVVTGCNADYGGGIYIWITNTASLTDVECSTNTALSAAGLYAYTSIDVTDSIFSSNIAENSAGGFRIAGGTATFTNCLFDNNSNGDNYGEGGAGTTVGGAFTNCIFVDNSSHWIGGALSIAGNTNLVNCTIANNDVRVSGSGTAITVGSGTVSLINCIVWGNTPFQIGGTTTVTYSDVQGGYTGTGNIDNDPLFVGSGDDPYSITESSPCADTGDSGSAPLTDYLGNSRVGVADMGAYEFQSEEPPVGESGVMQFLFYSL
jgi:hypothetical protein